jgi:hypothetical protein
MLDYGMPHLDSSIVADGWIKDTSAKMSSAVKHASKKASKFIHDKAPRVISTSVSQALKTLMDTGSITAAVTKLVTTAASESVDIGKTEAEKLIMGEYNKQAGTNYQHADFISFANGLPAHHKLLHKLDHVINGPAREAKYKEMADRAEKLYHPLKGHPDYHGDAPRVARGNGTVLPYLDSSDDESDH